MSEGIDEGRGRQIAGAAAILSAVALLVCGALLGWRYVPGLAGEWLGTMIGIMTTPFVLEASFAILGLVLVISLNSWRRHRDGDDFVYLEEVTGPDVPADLPDHAKWAVFTEAPLPMTEPTLLERAEGALAIGDHAAATEWLGKMSQKELAKPDTLKVRVSLAEATGRHDLAAQLRSGMSDKVG